MPKIRNKKCKDCGLHETAQFVCLTGCGPCPCNVVVVGEAPGFREDDSGVPFVGRAGEKLDELFKQAGLSRDDMYITNSVHCRPPDNRTPTKREIDACRKYLQAELDLVKPKYVLVLGATALMATLGLKGITDKRGQKVEKDGITYFITLHPAALFHRQELEPVVSADLRQFANLVKGVGDSQKFNSTLIDTVEKYRECLETLAESPVVTYDIETNIGYRPQDPRYLVYCIGLANDDREWLLPLYYPRQENPFYRRGVPDKLIAGLSRVLEGKELVTQNGLFDDVRLSVKFDWKPRTTFDTMLAWYTLDENAPHGLEYMASVFLGAPPYKDARDKINPKTMSLQELADYCCKDVRYTHNLRPILKKMLLEDKRLMRVFKELMMPGERMLIDASVEGIYLDQAKHLEATNLVRGRVLEALHKLKAEADINWNSTQQIGRVLYEQRGLPVLERTNTGKPSTREGVLLLLEDPIIDDLLEYRGQIKKYQFLESWGELASIDSRMHPSPKLHGAKTGRLSYEDPNTQQTPRDPLLRSCVDAPPGWTLVEADYSQVELRIVAMLGPERTMLRTFQTGGDIHALTAATILGIDPSEVTKDDRKKAKAVNFGFVYGMGHKKFQVYAREKYDVKLTLDEAKKYRDAFFDLYPDLLAWHDRQRRLVRKYGYVRTLSGRKRRLPDINSSDEYKQAEAERQAINSPVQGLGSDFNLFSAIRIRENYPWNRIRPIALIHDATLVYVRDDYLAKFLPQLHELMTNMEDFEETFEVDITVPIEVEIKVGPWGSGKVWTPES